MEELDYLRGINGVVVHVMPTNGLKFCVQLKGKMGWTESLIQTEDGGRWGGSGTLKVFDKFDDAFEVGIARVDELLEELKEMRKKQRDGEN